MLVIGSCSKDDNDEGSISETSLLGFWKGSEGNNCYEFCEDGTCYVYQINDQGTWMPVENVAKPFSLNGNTLTFDSQTFTIASCTSGILKWRTNGADQELTQVQKGKVPLMGVYRPKFRPSRKVELLETSGPDYELKSLVSLKKC